jgi:hypothetical protein
MSRGTLLAVRWYRGVLGEKLARLTASARRLPGRLARAVGIFADLASAAAHLELRAGLRRREDARLVRRSDLFDARFYLAQCPGERDARVDPVRHYFRKGVLRGLDPSPLFDTSAYLERHPEVGARGENPLAHYLRSRAPARPAALLAAPAVESSGAALLRARPFREPRRSAPCSVLVVDGTAPAAVPPARAGRMVALVEALRGSGHPVILFSTGAAPSPEEPSRRGELPVRSGAAAARAHLEAEGYRYGVVILAGPDEAAGLLPTARAYAPAALVVYDAAGVHGARLAHDALAAGDPAALAERERLRRVEKVNAASSDLVLAFTAHDREALLAEVPGARVEVLANEPVAASTMSARLAAILSQAAPGIERAPDGESAA